MNYARLPGWLRVGCGGFWTFRKHKVPSPQPYASCSSVLFVQ